MECRSLLAVAAGVFAVMVVTTADMPDAQTHEPSESRDSPANSTVNDADHQPTSGELDGRVDEAQSELTEQARHSADQLTDDLETLLAGDALLDTVETPPVYFVPDGPMVNLELNPFLKERWQAADQMVHRIEESLDEHSDAEPADVLVTEAVQVRDEFREANDLLAEADSHRDQYRETLDERGTTRWLWGRSVMPNGAELNERYEEADAAVESLTRAVSRTESADQLDRAQTKADEAVTDFDTLYVQTRSSHDHLRWAIPVGTIAVVVLLTGSVVVRRRRDTRRFHDESELWQQVERWEQRFDTLYRHSRKLHEQLRQHQQDPDAPSLDTLLSVEQKETVDLVFVLADRLQDLADTLRRRLSHATDDTRRQVVDELLDNGHIDIEPDACRHATVLQPKLQASYRFSRGELLDEFEELLERTQQIVE